MVLFFSITTQRVCLSTVLLFSLQLFVSVAGFQATVFTANSPQIQMKRDGTDNGDNTFTIRKSVVGDFDWGAALTLSDDVWSFSDSSASTLFMQINGFRETSELDPILGFACGDQYFLVFFEMDTGAHPYEVYIQILFSKIQKDTQFNT